MTHEWVGGTSPNQILNKNKGIISFRSGLILIEPSGGGEKMNKKNWILLCLRLLLLSFYLVLR